MIGARYEIFRGTDGLYYFRLVARNGKIVAASEAYGSRRGAWRGIEAARRASISAGRNVIDRTK